MRNLKNKYWIEVDFPNPLTNQWGECGEMHEEKTKNNKTKQNKTKNIVMK